jgi:iron complex outermembrane recepter protein
MKTRAAKPSRGFATARVQLRVVDELRSNITAGVSPIERTWSGSGGNPLMQPWRANAYDVSFEKYFSKASYLGIAGFYNKIM